MIKYDFKAIAMCSEFNISVLQKYYGVTRKIKWEEPLILKNGRLSKYKDFGNKMVYIFYFGTIVFVNFNNEEIKEFIEQLKNIEGSIKNISADMIYDCIDDFQIIEDTEEEINIDVSKVKTVEQYHINMVAIVLSKSVALETIENRVSTVSDEVEDVINRFKKGQIFRNEKKMVSTIGSVLSFKHTIISYIMLLDKPDAVWKNEESKAFFDDLCDMFELNDRYESITAKTDFLINSTQIFADFSNSKKSTLLELVVILLILIEVINAFKEPIIGLFS